MNLKNNFRNKLIILISSIFFLTILSFLIKAPAWAADCSEGYGSDYCGNCSTQNFPSDATNCEDFISPGIHGYYCSAGGETACFSNTNVSICHWPSCTACDPVCINPTTYCGDDSCNGTENCDTCPEDCGDCCGDGTCSPAYDEDCYNCPDDCGENCGTCIPCDCIGSGSTTPVADSGEGGEVAGVNVEISKCGATIETNNEDVSRISYEFDSSSNESSESSSEKESSQSELFPTLWSKVIDFFEDVLTEIKKIFANKN